MAKPTQMEAFDLTYALAASGGRGSKLFGDFHGAVRAAHERSLIGDEYPLCYIEFPLTGEPGTDILTVFRRVPPDSKFAPGTGFGYQAMFDWFSGVCGDDDVSAGIEVDLTAGVEDVAGAYLQQRGHHDLVAPFLQSLGESRRYEGYEHVRRSLPEGWPAVYIGLFPGREGSPVRIGGYMTGEEQRRCASDPRYLDKRLSAAGFEAYDASTLEQCCELMGLAPSVDFQFDILQDGSLGPTFGLALSLNEARVKAARQCLDDGYGAKLMRLLEERGLADSRWQLLRDVAFARQYPYERDDGSTGFVGLCVLLNYVKVKFIGGVAQPSKFYIALAALDI